MIRTFQFSTSIQLLDKIHRIDLNKYYEIINPDNVILQVQKIKNWKLHNLCKPQTSKTSVVPN